MIEIQNDSVSYTGYRPVYLECNLLNVETELVFAGLPKFLCLEWGIQVY